LQADVQGPMSLRHYTAATEYASNMAAVTIGDRMSVFTLLLFLKLCLY